MNCTVRIFLLNDDFSQEYADQHNNGQESELNRRYDWEDELQIKIPVIRFEEYKNDVFVLQGTLPDGKDFLEEVPNMRKFVFFGTDEVPVAQIACSELLFESFRDEVKGDELEFNLILKDREPLSNPVPGIYIAARDYPKSLIFE